MELLNEKEFISILKSAKIMGKTNYKEAAQAVPIKSLLVDIAIRKCQLWL